MSKLTCAPLAVVRPDFADPSPVDLMAIMTELPQDAMFHDDQVALGRLGEVQKVFCACDARHTQPVYTLMTKRSVLTALWSN